MADTDTIETEHTVDAPLSKDDYLAATGALQPGYTATIDGTDSNVGATVQSDARQDFKGPKTAIIANTLPGQVFAPHQLPNPKAAIDAGLPPVTVPEHLIVTDAEDHVSGLDPMDVQSLELRKALGNPRLNSSGLVETSDGDLVLGPGIPDAPADTETVATAPKKSKTTVVPPASTEPPETPVV